MKKIIISFFLFLFFQFTNNIELCYCQWYQINSQTNYKIESIALTGPDTLYYIANDSNYNTAIYKKTTNGGLNWYSFKSTSNWFCLNLNFINASTGFLCEWSAIEKTTNCGNSWNYVYIFSGDTLILNDIFFPDHTTGFAVGYSKNYQWHFGCLPKLLRTLDGGNNWMNLLVFGNSAKFKDLYFTDINTGYIIGSDSNGTFIRKSVNGGVGWSTITSGLGFGYNKILFTNLNTGYICCNGLLKTTNAGTNWFLSYYSQINDVFFINENTGYGVGQDGIIKTTNSGENWILQISSIHDLWSIKFFDANTGYAAGKYGIMMKTTNGGTFTNISQLNNIIPDNYSLSQNYPNPFNSSTGIIYKIHRGGYIQLKVYNINGQEIETLVNENQFPGTYEVSFNAPQYSSGVYFYRLIINEFCDTKKMILLK